MKIQEIHYEKKNNTGQWEHEVIKVVTTLEEGDSPEVVLEKLRALASGDAETGATIPAGPASTSQAAPAAPAARSPRQRKAEQVVVDKDKKEEKVVAETAKEDEGKLSDAPEKEAGKVADDNNPSEAAKEAVKTEVENPPADSAPTKTKRAAKASPYDRDLDLHKKKVGEFMDQRFTKTWRKELPDQAKAASASLVGEPFLDNEGQVLKEFIEKFVAKVQELKAATTPPA